VLSVDSQLKALAGTKMVYIGNLNFATTEPQIHEYFSKVRVC
jgi:RNA recognition motif-containing protein